MKPSLLQDLCVRLLEKNNEILFAAFWNLY